MASSSSSTPSSSASAPSFSALRLLHLEVIDFQAPPYSGGRGPEVVDVAENVEGAGAGGSGVSGASVSVEPVVIPAVGGDGVVVLPRRPSRRWPNGSLFPLGIAATAVANVLSWWRPGPRRSSRIAGSPPLVTGDEADAVVDGRYLRKRKRE